MIPKPDQKPQKLQSGDANLSIYLHSTSEPSDSHSLDLVHFESIQTSKTIDLVSSIPESPVSGSPERAMKPQASDHSNHDSGEVMHVLQSGGVSAGSPSKFVNRPVFSML